jgi:hypothetical protein
MGVSEEHDMSAHDTRVTAVAMMTAAFLLAVPLPAPAQERPSPVVEVAAGSLLFADDGIVPEAFLGGAARLYVTPRVSIGPEVSYVAGDNHSHLILTGNMWFDLLKPLSGRQRRVTPFIAIGAGVFQSRQDLFGGGTFTSNEGAFTAGGGVRGLVGDRVTVGAEARLGWETHLRVNGSIGVRLGR